MLLVGRRPESRKVTRYNGVKRLLAEKAVRIRAVLKKAAVAITRRPSAVAAGAVVLLAAALQLIQVDYGLPHIYFWDEPVLVNNAREMIIDGRPWPNAFYQYPSAIFDIQALVAVASYLKFLGSSPSFMHFEEVPVHHFYLLARLVTVAFSVAGVAVVYLFAARVWRKPWWGVAAAAALALSPHYIGNSRQVGVDVPMATLCIVAVYFLFRYGGGLRRRHFWASAVFMGAAAATKYNAFVFVIPTFLAFAFWRRPARDYVIFAAVIMGVYLILTPGTLFRLSAFIDCLGKVYYHYKVRGHQGLTVDQPALNLVALVWRKSMTPVPTALAAAGVGYVVWRWRRSGVLFVLFPLTFALAISGSRVASPRFVIDVFPFLVLLFAGGFGAVVSLLWRHGPRSLKVGATVVFTAVTLFGLALGTSRSLRAWAQEDPRTRGADWVHENVPWPNVIVKEVRDRKPLVEGGETDAPPIDETKYKVINVDWITRKPPAYWARRGAIYVVGHLHKSQYPARAQYFPGALDGARGDLRAFWRYFKEAAFFEGVRGSPGVNPICVYRLDDALLVEHHPYRRRLPLKACWAVKNSPPHDDFKFDGRCFPMYSNGRVGCFFTAPEGDYKIGFRLRPEPANGIPPRVKVMVDGERVADYAVPEEGVYWTGNIAASATRYHHLILEYYNDVEDLAGGDRNLFVGGIFVEPAG